VCRCDRDELEVREVRRRTPKCNTQGKLKLKGEVRTNENHR
jgi:hypothetical protein